jgi:hypothetical protein
MLTQRFKRGDTLFIQCTRVDPTSGSALSLSGVTVSSEMVRDGVRMELVVTVIDAAAGRFDLSLPATQTANLSTGVWLTDVEFRDLVGNVVSSDTYNLLVLEDVTGAAD